MKQLMVLVATIVLGIAISGTVLGFSENVDTLAGNVGTGIEYIGGEIDSTLTEAGVTLSN